jgi:hypothetical protein
MITIPVQYSCVLCGVKDYTIQVPARAEADDLIIWMQATIALIAQDHRATHPDCLSATLQDLKIPIDGAEWVGGPPVQ